jgi:hypothetical protein
MLKKKPVAKSVSTTKTNTSGKKFVIIMKGVVGCGKTTYGSHIANALKPYNAYCIGANTDKYCKTGMPMRDAVKYVERELNNLNYTSDHQLVVAIIDTCGDKIPDNNVIFNYDFSSWTKIEIWPNFDRSDMEGYLSWSLRNVLLRTKPTSTDNYFLEPTTAGVDTCIQVHQTKAKALFRNVPVLLANGINRERAIAQLNNKADIYQEMLTNTMVIDDQVKKIISKITNQI